MIKTIIFAVLFSSLVSAFIPKLKYGIKLLNRNNFVESSTALGLNTADFKNGMTIEIDGVPMKLIEFLHVKPGKGSAFVRTKVKNLVNNSVQEKTFRAGEAIVAADIDRVEMQYTFTDGNNLVFMNMESFEEQRIDKSKIDNVLLMKEGLSCIVMMWGEKIIDVQLPPSVSYKIVETAPNFKGNTAQGATKPATLDSGAIVNVPMFIETGESIIVSTDNCQYLGRDTGDVKNSF